MAEVGRRKGVIGPRRRGQRGRTECGARVYLRGVHRCAGYIFSLP
jgi:hypothetical protein